MITLNPFSHDPHRRTTEAVRAVRKGGDRLFDVRFDAYRAYRTRRAAHAAIDIVIARPDMDGLTIVVDEEPVGVAFLTHQLAIRKPGKLLSRLVGRRIDYFTGPQVSRIEHANIAYLLSTMDDYHGTVLGILTERQAELASGIPDIMAKEGEPGQIRLPFLAGDPYGLTTYRESYQVYAAEVPSLLT